MADTGWYVLIHNIPPKPSYLRVKVWRKLQRVGAVPVKNSVYVLPKTDSCFESFQWIAKEILRDKGDVTICEAAFIEGITDADVRDIFNKTRNEDYEKLANEIRELRKLTSKTKASDVESRLRHQDALSKFKKTFSEINEIDFFGAIQRTSTEGLLRELEEKLQATEPGRALVGSSTVSISDLQGRVWVTRKGIHVDRIASSWLISRFIDQKAQFKFVDAKAHRHSSKELRFDMYEGEFTHEGDLCSFEVLMKRTNLDDPPLKQISQIIHDIDLKDKKYDREDTIGIERVINGICINHKEDKDRLTRGCALFDDLYEYYSRKTGVKK